MAQGAPQTVMTAALIKEVFQLNCQIVADPISGTPLCVSIGRKHQAAQIAAVVTPSAAMPALQHDQAVWVAAG